MHIGLVTESRRIIEKVEMSVKGEYVLDISIDGENLLAWRDESPSIIILDHNINHTSAEGLCCEIRNHNIEAPVVMLVDETDTAKAIRSKVSSISKGADLCLGRNFDPQELNAQIKALIRRLVPKYSSRNSGNEYVLGTLVIDLWNRRIFRNKKTVPITKKELSLIEFFILNKGKILTKEITLGSVWGNVPEVYSNVVEVTVCKLRKTLKEYGGIFPIHTSHGIGYVFDPDDTTEGLDNRDNPKSEKPRKRGEAKTKMNGKAKTTSGAEIKLN